MGLETYTTPTTIFIGPIDSKYPRPNVGIIHPAADNVTISGKVAYGKTIDEAVKAGLNSLKDSLSAAGANPHDISWVGMEVDSDKAWGESKVEYLKFFNENGIKDYKPLRSVTQVTRGDQPGHYAKFKAIISLINLQKESSGPATVIVSGQAPDDLETEIEIKGTIQEKMAQAFKNVALYANQAKARLEDLSKMTIAVKELDKSEEIINAYNDFLNGRGIKIVTPTVVQAIHDGDYTFLLTPTFLVNQQYSFAVLGKGTM